MKRGKNTVPTPRRIALAAVFALGLPTASWATAYRCAVHLGAGCNGPTVYEIQLCTKASVNGATCARLCESLKPICNVSDFDPWVAAYNSGGFLAGRLGQNGFQGDLAQATNTENYDNDGQLAATSGNTYTVCMTSAKVLQSFHDNHPVSASVACPKVIVASATTCSGGTVFNGDPTNPRCVTSDSYCSNTVASGNFVTTMSAGFQMVAVQNQHFIAAPDQDPNLHGAAATAGTVLPGLQEPTKAPATDGGVSAATFAAPATNPSGGAGSSYGTGAAGTQVLASAESASAGTLGKNAVTDDSSFASKNFAMEGSAYKNGGSAGAAGEAGREAIGGSGPSWFGGGSASAGGASAELAIDGKAGGASRGLASDGRLAVEDPENYFLMSDVDVSLFKRITAQCRKKERSLVLAPMPAAAVLPHRSAN